jgi:hypothetical protein
MFGTNFDHGTIRKYYAYFASIFSDVYIDRTLANGTKTARIHVPIHFAKKDKALSRVQEDPTIDRKDAIFVPVMSFDMIDLRYSAGRVGPNMNRTSHRTSDVNQFYNTYTAAPYDFHFQLSIMVKNVNDGLKIVEQIIPYFRPDVTASLEIIPEMGIFHDIPIILTQIAEDDKIPDDYKERVTRIWVLDFVLQGVLYGPTKTTPIIKFANVIFTGVGASGNVGDNPFLKVTTQPGLTANGLPTTNVNNSVSYLTISIDDNYGYVITSTPLQGN